MSANIFFSTPYNPWKIGAILSESRLTVPARFSNTTFHKVARPSKAHDHAQTYHFRDTRSIRHLSPRKDPSSTKTKPFVAVRPKLKPPQICCLLIGWGWRPVKNVLLLALLSLISTSHPAAGLFSLSGLPTIRTSLRS